MSTAMAAISTADLGIPVVHPVAHSDVTGRPYVVVRTGALAVTVTSHEQAMQLADAFVLAARRLDDEGADQSLRSVPCLQGHCSGCYGWLCDHDCHRQTRS